MQICIQRGSWMQGNFRQIKDFDCGLIWVFTRQLHGCLWKGSGALHTGCIHSKSERIRHQLVEIFFDFLSVPTGGLFNIMRPATGPAANTSWFLLSPLYPGSLLTVSRKLRTTSAVNKQMQYSQYNNFHMLERTHIPRCPGYFISNSKGKMNTNNC